MVNKDYTINDIIVLYSEIKQLIIQAEKNKEEREFLNKELDYKITVFNSMVKSLEVLNGYYQNYLEGMKNNTKEDNQELYPVDNNFQKSTR